MKGEKVVRYINPKTGEGYEKKNWVDLVFDDDGYLFWVKKNHVRSFLDIPMPDCLSWAERGKVDYLKRFMMKNSQVLCYRSGNELKALADEDVARLLSMSVRYAKALIRKLVKLGVIKSFVGSDGTKWYMFNPIYGMRGKRLDGTVYALFQKELDPYLPEWVRRKFAQQAKEIVVNDKT